MKKLKSLRINYIEADEPKQEIVKCDNLEQDDRDRFEDAFWKYKKQKTSKEEDTLVVELPEPPKYNEPRAIVVIGPASVSMVHFSENIYEAFKDGYLTAYISYKDLRDVTPQQLAKKERYPISQAVKASSIKPDLIVIEECELIWDNDVNIPVFYMHREFKRKPTVNYPDVAFFWHEDIITFFDKILDPEWMGKVKHKLVMYPAVNTYIYEPQEKKYPRLSHIGFRETLDDPRSYPELSNIADMVLMKEQDTAFRAHFARVFDGHVSNTEYRKLLPQCEAIWIPCSTKQYISRRMLEAMACKTGCYIEIEDERHEHILENMGFFEGVHYTSRPDYFYITTNMRQDAYDLVREKHTYDKRVEEIIDLFKELGFSGQETYDVICPVYWTNKFFEKNVQNWFREIPIRKLYIGVNNKKTTIKIDDPRVEIIDQTRFKTLGACLADLMNRVETRWFVYLHSDVEITEKGFELLRMFATDNVGIVESERVHWDGHEITVNGETIPECSYENYINRTRAFSGFQLMRKRALEGLINKLEDDYLYRNEDMIFQSECVKNGYRYHKTWAMHVHQTLNTKWTFNVDETNDMQWKGLVKYTDPNEFNKIPCLSPLQVILHQKYQDIQHIIIFCQMYNPNWADIIVEAYYEWKDKALL